MAVKGIVIRWGASYVNTLDLNDLQRFRGQTIDLHSGAPQDIIVQDTTWNAPLFVRSKLKQRAFTIEFEPVMDNRTVPYTAAWWVAVDMAKRALYSGPVQVFVPHGLNAGVWQYVVAVCEEVVDPKNNGMFQAKMISADPIFTVGNPFYGSEDLPLAGPGTPPPPPDGWPAGTVVRIQQDLVAQSSDMVAADYNPNIVQTSYAGTAPTEPNVIFSLRGQGGPYRYYKDITITNRCPSALNNYPICLNLGTLVSGIGTKYHEIGGGDHRIKDIRLESPGGARKLIYIRDSGDIGGTWHAVVKIWTIIYSLLPGETKTLRLRYGNANADPAEVYPDAGNLKPMFNMYDSTNAVWEYVDFMPRWDQPASRAAQWWKYIPPNINIEAIDYAHPGFTSANVTLVPCAGGKAIAYGPTSGAAGAMLTVPVAVDNISFDYKISTNAKAPLTLFWQHRNGRWERNYGAGQPGYYADGNSAVISTIAAGHSWSGGSDVYVTQAVFAGVQFTAGYGCTIQMDDGSFWSPTIASVTLSSPPKLTMTAPGPGGKTASAGIPVQAQKGGSDFFTFTDPPLSFAWVMRGDVPTFNSGDWYYGGVETLTVNYTGAEVPNVIIGSEVDLAVPGKFHLVGTFGNRDTGEYLYINTVTLNTWDIVMVDCLNRNVWYFPYDPVHSTYGPAQSRFECLTFTTITPHWIHLEPSLQNVMVFIPGPNSNFTGAQVSVDYLIRNY